MQVRRACVEDAGRIAEIHVRSWQGGYQGLMPQEYLDSLDPAQRLRSWIEWIKEADWNRGGCFVVAGDDEGAAGFAAVGSSRDEDADAARIAEVNAIYLAPGAWGKGLGRELMAASLRHLAGCGYDEVTLWMLDSNARAGRFYQAAGFTLDGAVKVDDSRGFPLAEVRYRRLLSEAVAGAGPARP